jgi:ATP-dependent helicase/nuclease subunit A
MERERADNEAARVLYVAVTRAVRRLHLVGGGEPRGRTARRPRRPANSLLARLWPLVEAISRPPWPTLRAELSRQGEPASGACGASADEDAAHFVPRLARLRAPADPGGLARAAAARRGARATTPWMRWPPTSAPWCMRCWRWPPPSRGDWPPDASPRASPASSAGWRRAAGRRRTRARAPRAPRHARHHAGQRRRPVGAAPARRRRRGAGDRPMPGAAARQETRVVDRSFVEDGRALDHRLQDRRPRAGADAARLRAHAERYRAQLEAYAGLFAGEALPRRLAVFYVARGKLVTLD